MKLSVDEVADELHLQLVNDTVVESEEVAPGVIVDYDAEGEIIGLEVLHLTKRLRRGFNGFSISSQPKKAEISHASSL